MDKTGTLTEGKPVVTDIFSVGVGEDELLTLAASAEKSSEHPLASALIEKAEEKGLKLYDTNDFEAVSGRGVIASLADRKIYAGNKYFMAEKGIDVSVFEKKEAEYSDMGKTVLYFADENKPLGLIAVQDVPKRQAGQRLNVLRTWA